MGFGNGSLIRDSHELEYLLSYLCHHRSGEIYAFVGHSTGCQNIIHLLKNCQSQDLIYKIKVVALQGPVSDREAACSGGNAEEEKEKYEKLNKDKLSAAEKIAKNMQDVSINIIKQASDSGQLYGSVSTRDISDELNNQGHKIEKKQIVLKSVIKTVGQHEVRVVIHPEHIINIKVNIGRTLEELTFKSEEIENLADVEITSEKVEVKTEDKLEEIQEEEGVVWEVENR